MDQLPRLGKRELICLLSFTCNYVVFVWRGFLFLWVLGMGYVILLWYSLSLPYNYSTSQGGSTQNMALIGQAVSEKKMFENDDCCTAHVFSPWAGADNPVGYFVHKHNYSVNLVLCSKFSPLNNFVTFSPIQMYRRPTLTLS